MSSLFSAVQYPFGIAVGTAVGGAVSGAITPGVQEIINVANSKNAVKPPSYFMLAEGVAKGRVNADWAAARAAEQGIGGDAFTRLTEIANIGPGIDVAFELWRRNLIDDAGFAAAVKEEALNDSWLAPLEGLKEKLLSPAELANARQQEFIDDGRLESEGALQGYDAERMQLMFRMAGLPPGVMDGLTMLRRGIIDQATYEEIVAEGHTKTKYTPYLLQLQRQLLSPEVWAGLRLRGWVTEAEAAAGGALWGYTAEDMNRMYLDRGRPAAPGQMWTAAARGIDGQDGRPMDEAQFTQGIVESDIRPEYARMLWEIRYLYPSLFQLNRLVTSGAIDPATGADWATKARYAPEVVTALEASWSGAKGTTTAKWVSRAQSRLFTVTHNEYVKAAIDGPVAQQAMTVAGISGAEQTQVLRIWNEERSISRLELTTAEIRREYRKNIISQAEALSELEMRGMSAADATKYLTASGVVPPA